jgi:hypothetical protein
MPELPYVHCFVPVPDDCDLSISVSAYCDQTLPGIVVYPVPLDSTVVDERGYRVEECFRRDSIAYASEEWYPSAHAELAGEFRLRDQRIVVVHVYPVQYKASDDSLKVWSDIEVMVHLEGAQLNWTLPGLDAFDRLIGDRLIGYTPSTVIAPVSQGSVFRHEDMTEDPPFVPDYVIITADGLDGRWIEDLADHRAGLNGFDVLIANLDDIFNEYGESLPTGGASSVRDYMEYLWNRGSPGNRPAYLLLVGDIHVPGCTPPHYESWHLPSAQWGLTFPHYYANDDWFVMFNEDREVLVAPADMIVGRLSARTAGNIEDMIDLIIEYEQDASNKDADYLDYRRMIVRLAGDDHDGSFTSDQWNPSVGYTDNLRQWMGYNWDNYYCGDGNSETLSDGSAMSSADWVQACEYVFSRGSQVAFYTDHGHFHYFSAGMRWDTISPYPYHQGVPDSVFSTLNVNAINEATPPNHVHLPPFLLMLCCTAGTFNHTEYGHYVYEPFPKCCNDDGGKPPLFDLGVATLDEAFIRNTKGGAIGVFAGSLASVMGYYGPMGRGILESVYNYGATRTGDAISRMRLTNLPMFLHSNGTWSRALGQFNLLGDPAVDIGDRVLYPNACDLVISPSDLKIDRYPTRRLEEPGNVYLYATVRNTGAVASGAFPVTLTVEDAPNPTNLGAQCAGLDPGEETTLRFTWADHAWFSSGTFPAPLTLTAVADPQELTPDCWRPNNSATAVIEVTGFYPNKEGWPVQLPYSTKVPAVLADMTGDDDLEVIVLLTRADGKGILQVYDASANLLWETDAFAHESPLPSTLRSIPIPVVGNVFGDNPQIVVDARDALLIFDLNAPEPLFSYVYSDGCVEMGMSTAVVADLIPEQGQSRRDEIVVVRRNQLMVFDIQQHTKPYELILARSVSLPGVSGNGYYSWLMAEDIRGDATPEILVQIGTVEGSTRKTHFFIYDYTDGIGGNLFAQRTLSSSEWWRTIPAVGFFVDGPVISPVIAVSTGKNLHNQEPVLLLDATDNQLPVLAECESSPVTSNHVLCCMMTDWDPLIPGLDRVIANAENQAIAWNDAGRITWYREYDTGTSHPPLPALADLTENGLADVVAGNRQGVVFAFDHLGEDLADLGFPYTLPAEVYGGFVIADIDEDGVLEMVFGTMDNHLHVWELGECEEGYAPWPQAQGNTQRTGVLP